MKPGATIRPAASRTSAFCEAEIFPAGATSFIFSPSRRMSSCASALEAGSSTRPFLIRSIRGFLGFHFERRMSIGFRRAAGEQIQNGHANRDAVGDLLEDAGLRAVGNFGRDLDAAIDRAGMQNDRGGFGAPLALGVELI